MIEENLSQEFKLKKIEQTGNYFLEEIEKNELMSRKHKRFAQLYIVLNTFLF